MSTNPDSAAPTVPTPPSDAGPLDCADEACIDLGHDLVPCRSCHSTHTWHRPGCTDLGNQCPHQSVRSPSDAGPRERETGKPHNGQQEPHYPGAQTVAMSLRYPMMTAHRPTDRCSIQEPHQTAECGEFGYPALARLAGLLASLTADIETGPREQAICTEILAMLTPAAPAAEGPRAAPASHPLFGSDPYVRRGDAPCSCTEESRCELHALRAEVAQLRADSRAAALPGAEAGTPLTQLKQLYEKMQRADRYYEDHPDSYGAMCDAEAASDDFWSAVAARLASPSPTGAE